MDVQIDGGIQNTLSKFTEDFSEYNKLNKIKLYLTLLKSEYVDVEVKNRVKKQLNKEIMHLLLFEEEYDECYKENMF